MTDSLYIGEIANLFGISTKTLRHYEKLGLVEPRRAENDYRLYGPEDVLRVQRIRQLQTLGMSLQEIGRVLESQDDEELWDGVLRRLRDDVEDEIAALHARRERLEELLEQEKPPGIEDLAPVPERVNEYLEQNLPEASLHRWQQDRAIFTLLGHLLRGPRGARSGKGHGDFPVMLPSRWPDSHWSPGTAPEELNIYYSGVRNVLAALDQATVRPDEEESK